MIDRNTNSRNYERPIIGLITLGKLSLLRELFDKVIIPHAGYVEVTCDRSSYPHHIFEIDEAVNSGKIKVFNVKNQEFIKQLQGKLHDGELEVVVGAKVLGISTVIIDERAARNFKSSMLFDTLGIIGILQLANRQNKIAEIKNTWMN